MPLFSRFSRKVSEISAEDIDGIRKRVREMRDEVGRRDLELADLFALVAEDERPALREMSEVRRPEIKRQWPADVPAQAKPSPEPSPPEPTYGDWEVLRRKDIFTTP